MVTQHRASDPPEDEKEWRARMFKSKKALPRPYKPVPTRALAPRPTPETEPQSLNRAGSERSNAPGSSGHGTETSASPPPELQFIPASQFDLKPNSNRKRVTTHETEGYAREKRRKFLQRMYSDPETRTDSGSRDEETNRNSPPFESVDSTNAHRAIPDLQPEHRSGICAPEIKSESSSPREMPSISRLWRRESWPSSYERTYARNAIGPSSISLFGASRIDPFSSSVVQITPQMDLLIGVFSYHIRRSESSQPFAVFSSLLIPDHDLVYAKNLLGVKDPGTLHSVFPILFRMALADTPLFNTLLFIGEFASRGRLTEVALKFQGDAIRSLNEKLRDPWKAMDNASIATILFLSGFEYIRGNNRGAHEAHMQGLSQLLKIRDEFGMSQPETLDEREVIERGLFWADLLGAIILNSPRFFSLQTFSTLRLLGSISRPSNPVPPGFERSLHLLDSDLIEIIRDIVDFQDVISSSHHKTHVTLHKLKVFNDRKASIEYRLASLNYRHRDDGKAECIRLAVYLYSSAIFPPIFGPPALATVLSGQLARALARAMTMTVTTEAGATSRCCWEGVDVTLLVWICFMGASYCCCRSATSTGNTEENERKHIGTGRKTPADSNTDSDPEYQHQYQYYKSEFESKPDSESQSQSYPASKCTKCSIYMNILDLALEKLSLQARSLERDMNRNNSKEEKERGHAHHRRSSTCQQDQQQQQDILALLRQFLWSDIVFEDRCCRVYQSMGSSYHPHIR